MNDRETEVASGVATTMKLYWSDKACFIILLVRSKFTLTLQTVIFRGVEKGK